MMDIWEDICKKKSIRNGQKIRNILNPKMSVARFMALLKKNQYINEK